MNLNLQKIRRDSLNHKSIKLMQLIEISFNRSTVSLNIKRKFYQTTTANLGHTVHLDRALYHTLAP